MRFGVDVGGTTVKIGVCSDKKVVDTFVVKTTVENLFKDIFEGIKNYAKEHKVNPRDVCDLWKMDRLFSDLIPGAKTDNNNY